MIRDAVSSDELAWRGLWAAYLAFYDTSLPDAVTAKTWERAISRRDGLYCRIAEVDGDICGFSLSVLHAGTWTTEPVCYLEDLFVASSHRGKGLGAALIRDLVSAARSQGWARLYWHTRATNADARRVYDRFTLADDFVRYRLIF